MEALSRRSQLLLLLREEFEDDEHLDGLELAGLETVQEIIEQRIAFHALDMLRTPTPAAATATAPSAGQQPPHAWEGQRCPACGLERTAANEQEPCPAAAGPATPEVSNPASR